MLGTRIDPDLDGLPSTAADADDTTGADDDDGVAFPPLAAGASASLTVTVTNSGPAARLNAWADWNNNGSFTDVGEQIATDPGRQRRSEQPCTSACRRAPLAP